MTSVIATVFPVIIMLAVRENLSARNTFYLPSASVEGESTAKVSSTVNIAVDFIVQVLQNQLM